MSQSRIIGRVLSVDNFRVYIKIEEDLRGAYKSGIKDIYEVARINSYLIIPVGSDRVVALITHVSMKEELDLEKTSSSIKLPTSARYISATMLGTITQENGSEIFVQGVYNFPTLDNPVWYVTEKDLQQIFDDKDTDKIDYSNDYYLPIGTSPAFPNYKVKICSDQFFVKHAAILGNTGSGKSCTFTSIIRNLFKFQYEDGKILENAHFVIFDTNGEYKDAFLPTKDKFEKLDEPTQRQLSQVNAYYYGGIDKVQVPYWFMNWENIKSLFNPSEGTQAPVLNRAIGFAKNDVSSNNTHKYSRIVIQKMQEILNHIQNSGSEYWKINNYKETIDDLKQRNIILNDNTNVTDILSRIYFNGPKDYKIPTASELEPILADLSSVIQKMEAENQSQDIICEQNIDMPTWFSYQELCEKFIDAAINQEGQTNNRISEFVSTLRLRMRSFLNDKRMAIPLMLKDTNKDNRDILSHFIAFLLGDFNRCFAMAEQHGEQGKSEQKDSFIKKYNDKADNRNKDKTNQITIIDLSQLPFEVLETITALLGRLIIEFVSNFMPNQRGQYPVVIVLEEAQNYIAENKNSVAKTVFERIAREGRKYGISLVVCSQRPSELSKTVLSQCNSFIIHRLQNPDDQKYVKGLVSSASSDILDQLPIIPQQHAIITGDCVRTPIQVKIDNVNPTPNSHNPKYIEKWLDPKLEIPYEKTCNKWLGIDNRDQVNI